MQEMGRTGPEHYLLKLLEFGTMGVEMQLASVLVGLAPCTRALVDGHECIRGHLL